MSLKKILLNEYMERNGYKYVFHGTEAVFDIEKEFRWLHVGGVKTAYNIHSNVANAIDNKDYSKIKCFKMNLNANFIELPDLHLWTDEEYIDLFDSVGLSYDNTKDIDENLNRLEVKEEFGVTNSINDDIDGIVYINEWEQTFLETIEQKKSVARFIASFSTFDMIDALDIIKEKEDESYFIFNKDILTEVR